MLSPKQWAVIVGFVLYTLGVWHISSEYRLSQYREKENLALKQSIAIVDTANKELQTLQTERAKKQKVITKEVIREVEKPIYRECHTTDGGVQLIERAIDTANEALSGS